MTQIWRRANESVSIGEGMTVKVLEVGQSFVRLAILCPQSNPSYQEVELTCDPVDEYDSAELELVGAERPRC